MINEQMREFEAWAETQDYDLAKNNGVDYWADDTTQAFKAWQAATLKATLAERERCALIVEGYPQWLGRAAKRELSISIRGVPLPPTSAEQS